MDSGQFNEAAVSGEEAANVVAPRTSRRIPVLKILFAVIATIVLVASVASLVLIQLGYPRVQGVIPTDLIEAKGEHVYIARLPHPPGWPGLFSFHTDGPEDARASSLQLFEDGVAIGPPHTAHVSIAGSGGAYSHWNDVLYFSSTRGDDPRTSGREYRIAAPYAPAPWILPTLTAAALLSFVLLVAVTIGRSVVRFGYAALKLLGRVTITSLVRFGPATVYAITVVGIVAMVSLSLVNVPQVYPLEPASIRAGQGYSYEAQFPDTQSSIPLLEPIRANRNSTNAPNVRLLEDGKEVGMARSRAALVESMGAGRYIVTDSRILFSTVDNSDPRANGNSYAIQQRLVLSPSAGVAVLLLVVASLMLMARKRARLVVGGLSGVAAALGAFGLLTYFDIFTQDEFVSPANVYQVTDDTYGFSVNGNIAPFIFMAPLGAPTATGIGDSLVTCEREPASIAALSDIAARSGKGACAPRTSGFDIDYVAPARANEGAVISFYRYPIRMHWYAVVGLLLLSALLLPLVWLRLSSRHVLIGTGAMIGGLGALLMAANLSGYFFSLRVTAPTEPMPGVRTMGPRLPLEEGVRQISWNEGDTADGYASRVNRVIFESMVHGNPASDLGRWRLEIPIWENWSLHALGVINPKFQSYRFWDYRKEFERGIGLCGDMSAMLVGYLTERGIQAKVVGLHGHVVATVEVRPDVWHIYDPDYGVVLPHSLEEVEVNPGLIESAYKDATVASEVAMIVGYYTTPENNSIDPSGRDGFFSGVDGSAEVYRNREQFMEWLKWIAPSLMLAAGFAIGLGAYLLRRRRRDPSGQAETLAVEPAAAAGPA